MAGSRIKGITVEIGGDTTKLSYDTIVDFASKIKATLTVMKSGEHWFHTKEQMEFLDNWLMRLV